MKASLVASLAFLSVVVMSTAQSAEPASMGKIGSEQTNLAVAKKLALLAAPIKSSADLQEYTSNIPSNSPLLKLSPEATRRFLDSLTFNENGITGFYYGDLEAELTPKQAYQVLSLFGAQNTTWALHRLQAKDSVDQAIMSAPCSVVSIDGTCGGDHQDYWCAWKGTCQMENFYICTSNC